MGAPLPFLVHRGPLGCPLRTLAEESEADLSGPARARVRHGQNGREARGGAAQWAVRLPSCPEK